MKIIVRNVLAMLGGLVVGSLVNIGLVNVGPFLIPLPEGADVSSIESLKESMDLFRPVNFVFPFLAHALGTLSGAFAASKIASSHKMKFALGIGAVFLVGGIMAVRMLGGPMWFNILDIVMAYIPMGYLGGRLGTLTAAPVTPPATS